VEKHFKKFGVIIFNLGDKDIDQDISWAYDVTVAFEQELNDGLIAKFHGVEKGGALIVIQYIPVDREFQKVSD
jgi:hypothetical protein